MMRVRLSDGTMVSAPSVVEARVIDREVGETDAYFKHGITLSPDACVVDAGANAGLFAVRLLQRYPAVRLYSFEPIPDVFAMLQANVAEHRGPAAVVKTFNVALGEAPGEAVFELDPQATFAASMANDAVEASYQQGVSTRVFASALLGDMGRVRLLTPSLARVLQRVVALPLLGWIVAGPVRLAAALQKRQVAGRKQQIRCAVRTLSEMFAAEGIARVDLLKVDVEGAEEAVLNGIAAGDWPRIRQVVVEVHDANGRAARLSALLQAHGFRTVLDREDWEMHALLGIRTLYAMRP